MTTPPTIDHDPNEKPHPTRGEAIFVAIITTVALVAVGAFLKWLSSRIDATPFLALCVAAFIALLAIACWQEWKKRRRLW